MDDLEDKKAENSRRRAADKLRRANEEAEARAKMRKRPRTATSFVSQEDFEVKVTPDAVAFFEENKEEFEEAGFRSLQQINPARFQREKVTKRLLELILESPMK